MRPSDMNRLAIPLLGLATLCGCGTSSTSTATAVPTGQPTTSPAVAVVATSAGATASGSLVYVGPAGSGQKRVTRTVGGAALDRLLADLAALKSSAGQMACTLENGESGTLSVVKGGHTMVYVVAGEPCRGVRVTSDGAAQPGLAGSVQLVTDLRAIAGGGSGHETAVP